MADRVRMRKNGTKRTQIERASRENDRGGEEKTLPFLLGLLTGPADPLRNRNGPEKRITGSCI